MVNEPVADPGTQGLQHLRPREVLQILQGQEQYRILAALGHVIRPGPVDCQAVEEVAALCFFFNGEEILQHTQRQGLAEPPGPRNQRHRTVPVDELADKVCLIDKIIMFAPYIKKIIDTNRQLPLHSLTRFLSFHYNKNCEKQKEEPSHEGMPPYMTP